jgi:hypothetical protein
MGKAIGEVFSKAWHGLCTSHTMQNATKHLYEDKSESNEDNDILSDFSACMYEYEGIAEFEHKFELMRKKK